VSFQGRIIDSPIDDPAIVRDWFNRVDHSVKRDLVSPHPLSFLVESLSSSRRVISRRCLSLSRYPCDFPSPIAPSDCQGQTIPPSCLAEVLSAPFSLSRREWRAGKYKVPHTRNAFLLLSAAPPATLVTHKSELAAPRSSITRSSLDPARGCIREIGQPSVDRCSDSACALLFPL